MKSDIFEVLGFKPVLINGVPFPRFEDDSYVQQTAVLGFLYNVEAQRLIDASVRTQLPVELSGY